MYNRYHHHTAQAIEAIPAEVRMISGCHGKYKIFYCAYHMHYIMQRRCICASVSVSILKSCFSLYYLNLPDSQTSADVGNVASFQLPDAAGKAGMGH